MNKDLIKILVCPKTKGPLTYHKKNQELISENGIPIMIIEKARKIKK